MEASRCFSRHNHKVGVWEHSANSSVSWEFLYREFGLKKDLKDKSKWIVK